MDSSFPSLSLLCDNISSVYMPAVEVLIRLAKNINNNPQEIKYRKVRVANAIIQEKLLPVSGAIELLFEMGFQEDDDHFMLPMSHSLDNLKSILAALQLLADNAKHDSSCGAEGNSSSITEGSFKSGAVDKPASELPPLSSQNPVMQNQTALTLLSELDSRLRHVILYEDRALQQKACSVMPVDNMKQAAQQRWQAMNKPSDVSVADLLLLELLDWFKRDFFTWTDAPKCHRCSAKTASVDMVPPTDTELMWGGNRVERYQCIQCSAFTRFPRYNHPSKLLDTRTGRCGEWANCFTLCCRALDFDARYILDLTDHVWTEVYSDAQGKWMHCDPCEGICDKPLIYEAGWGKKLTYVFAFSRNDIQDVTWRYSSKHEELRQRRTRINENLLTHRIMQLRASRQKHLDAATREKLTMRTLLELSSFFFMKDASKAESEQGRISGSLQWRLARGETGGASDKCGRYVFSPCKAEVDALFMEVTYNCATDVYTHLSNANKQVKGWRKMVDECTAMFRKEEHDWKMAYLAREEGAASASVSWKWDMADSGCVIEKVEILCLSKCFESGRISWRLCGDDSCRMDWGFSGTENGPVTYSCFSGSKSFSLHAELSGGNGQNAWQHTQLFRQSTADTTLCPFKVKLTLKKA